MPVLNKHKYVGVLLMLCVAACACLFLTRPVGEPPQSGIAVMVARRSLPAMTVVTVDDFVKHMVLRREFPKGQISSPTRVIGRVLAIPVVEGQVLTESCFVSEGTGAQLVAAIPDSLKPFTLYLSSTAAPDRLYPGSVVDVLFSPKLSGRDAPGKATVTTILRGIQVLAVEGNSVVSNPEQEGEAKTRRVGGGVQVTLLVYKEQAEALRWAVGRGNISLAIRNPLDKRNVPNRNRLAPDLPTDADPEHLRAFGGMLGD